jgi:hypothetical protein
VLIIYVSTAASSVTCPTDFIDAVAGNVYVERYSRAEIAQLEDDFIREVRAEHRAFVTSLLVARRAAVERAQERETLRSLSRCPRPVPALVSARGPLRPAPRAPPIHRSFLRRGPGRTSRRLAPTVCETPRDASHIRPYETGTYTWSCGERTSR